MCLCITVSEKLNFSQLVHINTIQQWKNPNFLKYIVGKYIHFSKFSLDAFHSCFPKKNRLPPHPFHGQKIITYCPTPIDRHKINLLQLYVLYYKLQVH